MMIRLVVSRSRVEARVTRQHDGARQALVVWCTWLQPPAETMSTIRDQLTDEEAAELHVAFGLALDRSPA